LFGNEKKVALHQPDGNSGHDGLEDTDSGCVRERLLAAAPLLPGFEIRLKSIEEPWEARHAADEHRA
jgi:hypothetical protein